MPDGPHIPEGGWLVTGKDVDRLSFFEFQSTGLEGKPIEVAKRQSAVRQLTAEQAAELLDPNRVLAARDHWKAVP